MRAPLSPLVRLEARDQGAGLHPLDQALLLLGLADPAADGLAALPLAERDRRLLAHRQATFGDRMECLADCPACGATQEFELSTAALLAGLDVSADEVIEVESWRILLRSLNSADLALAAREPTAERAQCVLVAQAIVEASGPEGEPLPDRLWLQVAELVAAREAAGETALNLTCSDCGATNAMALDVGAHVWAEVEADARRLLGEIAILAERFGWSEAALLTMPPRRRRAYLDLLGTP